VILFSESAGDFSPREKSRMAVRPTYTLVKSEPATLSQGVKRAEHESDN
jgi:hypothetical protein